MLYLLIFRYDDIPREELGSFLKSQDAVKMNVFLEFLFDIEGLREQVYDQWCLIYEDNYIEQILEGLDKKRDELGRTLAYIIEKAVGKGTATDTKLSSKLASFKKEEVKKYEPTKPEPFNLSQPKPRALPEPIKIEKKVKANPIPKTLFSTNLQKIEEEKNKRKEAIKKQTEEDYKKTVKPFELTTADRETNPEREKRKQEELLKKQELEKNKKKRDPLDIPDFGEVEIKLNTAAIMKEALAIKQRREDIEKQEKDIELNNRDGTEFELWRERAKRIDREEELKRQMERKIEMELAQEAAKKAIAEKEAEKKKNAEKLKEEKEIDLKRKEKIIKKDIARKQELKEEIQETRGKVVKVKNEIVKGKAVAVEEMKEKMKIEIELKKLEEKKQQEIRDQLILKIRELDRKVVKKTKDFDPNDHVSHGLLEEMNLVQLEEKLDEMKAAFKKQEEEKRSEIQKAKEKKNNQVKEMMEMISDARNGRSNANEAKRQHRKNKIAKREDRIQKESDRQVVEAYKNIINKKEKLKIEDEELQRKAKEIRLKKQYMKADQDKVEEQAWKNLEDGAEREAMVRQNRKLIEQEAIASVKLKERELIAENAIHEFQATLDRQREYNLRQDQEERDKELLNRMMRQSQKEMVDSIKDFKASHSKNVIEDRPYEHKITQLSRSGDILKKDAFAHK